MLERHNREPNPPTADLPPNAKHGYDARTHASQRDIAECAKYDRDADARTAAWHASTFADAVDTLLNSKRSSQTESYG